MGDAAYRDTFKRIGIALILFGALDIAYMIYCIMHRISYSSSFNIFAVISGIYVWRRHPWYLKWVPRAAAFAVAALSAVVVLVPFFMPLELQIVEFRTDPVGISAGLIAGVAVTVFLWWIYREFRVSSVLQYYAHNGLSTEAPRYAFIAGAALALVLWGFIYSMTHGANAAQAVALAQGKSGPGYRYWVSNISFAGAHGSARVLAYNAREVKTVGVEW